MGNQESRGRFAPSPSGRMHLGNVWAMLAAWLSMRKQGGTMILRMEDLDPSRSKQIYADQMMEDLAWLGLSYEEGPDCGGAYGPYTQEERRNLYEEAMNRLKVQGHLYPCYCSRKDLQAVRAPHRGEGANAYPGTCRYLSDEERKLRAEKKAPAMRFLMPDREDCFVDLNYGKQCQSLQSETGDFILRRSDGIHAYQLAVVVDDALMGITEVVRGADLLSSSHRQRILYESLGYSSPKFGHVPLLMGRDGRRMSKRFQSLDLGQLKSIGWKPEELWGLLLFEAGMMEKEEAVTLQEAIEIFSWETMGQTDLKIDLQRLER
ncbi:tRNA glutamyl-Q(34) synthetase GluQRS [Gottschalkiaceae bacterium SANA]|nr:tRNA glutamyl-Q(34) synthetase GluQRS [Gottschalkiaceae bacterium SANA]